MKVEATKIFAKYLARDAPSLVNVNQSAVENLEKKLDKPDKEIFNIAQDQVGVLRHRSSINHSLFFCNALELTLFVVYLNVIVKTTLSTSTTIYQIFEDHIVLLLETPEILFH